MDTDLEELQVLEKMKNINILQILNQGIYYIDPLYGILHEPIDYIGTNNLLSTWHTKDGNYCRYYYKDYGRTWALTREELEQNS